MEYPKRDRVIEIRTATTLDDLMHQIADEFSHDEIIDAIVKMDAEIICDWDFSTEMYLRYESIMEQLKKEESDGTDNS